MNPYDKAHELAKSIRESTEFRDMEAALAVVEADADSKRMLEDFRARQISIQEQLMKGEELPPEEITNMENLYEVISLNPAVRRLFEAERRLAVLTEDIQRIITEPISGLF